MNRYNSLLSQIATDLNIRQGNSESIENYKSRLIYSAVSRIGYASLWDKLEDSEMVSMEYLKHRIENTLRSYLKMYPEVKGIFPGEYNTISEYIYNTFLVTGNVYHSPYRISPPMRTQASFNGIRFTRGTSLSEKVFISGIGTFFKCSDKDNMESVRDMFGLIKHNIADYWKHYSENVTWSTLKTEDRFEFFKTSSISQGYVKETPDKDIGISLMRTTTPGTKIYYFYRWNDNKIEISQIPYWLTDENRYFYLLNGLLASKSVLPEIKYRIDGAISYLQVGYHLPPAEHNLIMLYSWPQFFNNIDSPFSRVIDTSILNAIMRVFINNGFTFKKEQ